jgi:hypothetical protein
MNLRLPLIITCALAAGCQTSDEPGYVEVVAGDYRVIAGCFAGQPLVDEDATLDPAKPQQLLAGNRVSIDDRVGNLIEVEVGMSPVSGPLYAVRFLGVGEGRTEIRGVPYSQAPIFFWPNQVMPVVARCTGRVQS